MKLYDFIPDHNYAVLCSEYNCSQIDVTREDEEYKTITLNRTLNLDELKADDLSVVYDAIRYADGDDADNIEFVAEYRAVTSGGETVDIYVPDLW